MKPKQSSDEEDREWPDPKIPLYYKPQLAVPLSLVGIAIQYIWVKYILQTFGFYTLLAEQMSSLTRQVVQVIESILATMTTYPGPELFASAGDMFIAVFIGSLLMLVFIFPILFTALSLQHPIKPNGPEISG